MKEVNLSISGIGIKCGGGTTGSRPKRNRLFVYLHISNFQSRPIVSISRLICLMQSSNISFNLDDPVAEEHAKVEKSDIKSYLHDILV